MLEMLDREEMSKLKQWARLKYNTNRDDFIEEHTVEEILIDHNYDPSKMDDEEKYYACCEIGMFNKQAIHTTKEEPSSFIDYIDMDLEADLFACVNQVASNSCMDRSFNQCTPDKYDEFKAVLQSSIRIVCEEKFSAKMYKLYDQYSYGRFSTELIIKFVGDVAVPYVWYKESNPKREPELTDLYPAYYSEKVAFFVNYDKEQSENNNQHIDESISTTTGVDSTTSVEVVTNNNNNNNNNSNNIGIEQSDKIVDTSVEKETNKSLPNNDEIANVSDILDVLQQNSTKEYEIPDNRENIHDDCTQNSTNNIIEVNTTISADENSININNSVTYCNNDTITTRNGVEEVLDTDTTDNSTNKLVDKSNQFFHEENSDNNKLDINSLSRDLKYCIDLPKVNNRTLTATEYFDQLVNGIIPEGVTVHKYQQPVTRNNSCTNNFATHTVRVNNDTTAIDNYRLLINDTNVSNNYKIDRMINNVDDVNANLSSNRGPPL